MSCVTYHFYSSSFFLQSVDADWWRVSYQRGRPRLVLKPRWFNYSMLCQLWWRWFPRPVVLALPLFPALSVGGREILHQRWLYNWNPGWWWLCKRFTYKAEISSSLSQYTKSFSLTDFHLIGPRPTQSSSCNVRLCVCLSQIFRVSVFCHKIDFFCKNI